MLDDGHWIYIKPDGEKAFEATFYYAGDFTNGLAKVRFDGRWGYINLQGKEV